MTEGDGVLAALGLKLGNVIVGAVSSFVALRFFDNLSFFSKWTTFLGGWALAAWGAEPMVYAFGLNPKVEVGIVLLLGLLGMALTAELVRMFQSVNWDVIKGLIRK